MDSIELEIKKYFSAKRAAGKEDLPCPSAEEFYLFLTDRLEGHRLEGMLDHLRKHPEDRKIIEEARQMLEEEKSGSWAAVPGQTIQKAKDLLGQKKNIACPHCGKAITPFKPALGSQTARGFAWLGLAALSFALSFSAHRYFLQFIALGVFFGIKWALDQRATRTQILIYKALKENEEHDPTHSHRRTGTFIDS